MPPAELKEALWRTFDARLSPPQLGVIFHFFRNTEEGPLAEHTCDGGAIVCFAHSASEAQTKLYCSGLDRMSVFPVA